MIIHIIKRDGRKVPFNVEKIANAIFKAAQAKGGTDFDAAMDVARYARLMRNSTPARHLLLRRFRISLRRSSSKRVMPKLQRLIFSTVTSAHAHVR